MDDNKDPTAEKIIASMERAIVDRRAIVDLIASSTNRREAVTRVAEYLAIDEVCANAVTNMRLDQFTLDELERFQRRDRQL